MKKIIVILAVVALTASCFASSVTITATAANKVVTIGYTGATGAVPVGISMQVSRVSGDGTVSATSYAAGTSVHKVFPDYVYSNPSTVLNATTGEGSIPPTHPIAMIGGPGVPTFPATNYALCMGKLGAAPAASGTLAVITLTCSTNTVLSFGADTSGRGGIVGNDGQPMTVTWPANLTVTCAGCATCKGDINGDGRVRTADLGLLIGGLNTYGTNFDAALMPCGDMNGDGRVRTADLGLLIGAMNTYGTNILCPIPGY